MVSRFTLVWQHNKSPAHETKVRYSPSVRTRAVHWTACHEQAAEQFSRVFFLTRLNCISLQIRIVLLLTEVKCTDMDCNSIWNEGADGKISFSRLQLLEADHHD